MTNAIKVGKLLSITEGAYSNYGLLGFFVVIRELDYTVELEKFLEENPIQRKDYNFEPGKFLGYLISHGFLLEIDHTVLYLGRYGNLEEVSIIPPADTKE